MLSTINNQQYFYYDFNLIQLAHHVQMYFENKIVTATTSLS